MLTQEPRLAGARATTETNVTLIPSSHIKNSVEQFPIWMRTVIKDFIIRIKHVNENYLELKVQNEYLIKKSTQHRELALSLIHLIELIWSGKNRSSFGLSALLPKLHESLDCSIDTLNFIVNTFVDVGLLSRSSGKVIVHSKAMANLNEYKNISKFYNLRTKTEVDHKQLKDALNFLKQTAPFKLHATKEHCLTLSDLRASPLSGNSIKEISAEQLDQLSESGLYGVIFNSELQKVTFTPNLTSIRVLALLALDRFAQADARQNKGADQSTQKMPKAEQSAENILIPKQAS